mmetsp:Transcript_34146/g.133674  ORF Transcript_34146/g.133674 Transcript_34146/m.133674 type:complete len:146 (-) Transcript_34146:2699-3136(-)
MPSGELVPAVVQAVKAVILAGLVWPENPVDWDPEQLAPYVVLVGQGNSLELDRDVCFLFLCTWESICRQALCHDERKRLGLGSGLRRNLTLWEASAVSSLLIAIVPLNQGTELISFACTFMLFWCVRGGPAEDALTCVPVSRVES